MKEGRFRGLALQHCLTRSRKPSGQDDGIGRCKELLPTPQIIADESTSLYGFSQSNISQRTTPYDLKTEVELGSQSQLPIIYYFLLWGILLWQNGPITLVNGVSAGQNICRVPWRKGGQNEIFKILRKSCFEKNPVPWYLCTPN